MLVQVVVALHSGLCFGQGTIIRGLRFLLRLQAIRHFDMDDSEAYDIEDIGENDT